MRPVAAGSTVRDTSAWAKIPTSRPRPPPAAGEPASSPCAGALRRASPGSDDDRVFRADARHRHLVWVDVLREDVKNEVAVRHHPDQVVAVEDGQRTDVPRRHQPRRLDGGLLRRDGRGRGRRRLLVRCSWSCTPPRCGVRNFSRSGDKTPAAFRESPPGHSLCMESSTKAADALAPAERLGRRWVRSAIQLGRVAADGEPRGV